MNRGDLSEMEWARLAPLLPPQKPRVGRPAGDHRRVLNGVLWVLRTGAPWRDLPARYGKWTTVASRFYRWRIAGVWDRVLTTLQAEADADGKLDWSKHHVDATIVRAHQHAAGAKGGDPEAEGLGRSQGGFSTKLHVRAEGGGKPLTFVLTPGQRHETIAFDALMERGALPRRGRGRPRLRPRALVGDKAYSTRAVRAYLRCRQIRAVIPSKSDQPRNPRFDRAMYRLRNVVERLINRLKQFRRVATRYEKRGINYLAMVTLAAIRLWL
jgi:transposase